ncbi:unnamed protein product, partial [Polarella glacialis]
MEAAIRQVVSAARKCPGASVPLPKDLLQATDAELSSLHPPILCRLAWALGRQLTHSTRKGTVAADFALSSLELWQGGDRQLLLGLCPGTAAGAELGENSPDPVSLANLLWALASVAPKSSPNDIRSELTRFLHESTIARVLATVSGVDLARTLWALGSLRVNHDVFERSGSLHFPSARTQCLSNVLWASARVGRRVPLALHDELCRRVPLPFPELTSCLWALATLSDTSSPVWDGAVERSLLLAAAPSSPRAVSVGPCEGLALATCEEAAHDSARLRYNPQSLSNSLWAIARLRGQLSNSDISAAQAMHDRFKPQEFSNCLWAIGKMDQPALDFFRTVRLPRLQTFEDQHISNVLWAFAASSVRRVDLLESLGSEALSRRGFSLQAVANIAWAFSTLRVRSDALRDHLWHLAERKLQQTGGVAAEEAALRRLGARLDGRVVIAKPPGWEVDTGEDEPPAGVQPLSSFTVAAHSVLISPAYGHGFINRLDSPSSGLVLQATSFEGLFFLRAQRELGMMDREYVVLCIGWVPGDRSISARVRLPSSSEASLHGRPALTELKVLSHLQQKSEGGLKYSLLALRIQSGRTHQIRCHLAYIGHPVAGARQSTLSALPLDLRQVSEAASMQVPVSIQRHSKAESMQELRGDRGRLEMTICHHVGLTKPALQGRGGGVRIRHGDLDVAVFSVYAPNEPGNSAGRKSVQAFYQWLFAVTARLPKRTMKIFLGDFNAHVGSRSDELPDAGPVIGPYQPQQENSNGAMMRQWLGTFGMTAANTHFRKASGPTFWSPSRQGSRIDYIALPAENLPDVIAIDIWRRAALQLQIFRSATLRDHSPVHAVISLPRFQPPANNNNMHWDHDKLRVEMREIIHGNTTASPFLSDVAEFFNASDSQNTSARLSDMPTPDQNWDFISGGLREIAIKHFAKPPFTPYPITPSARTVELRQQATERFKSFESPPATPVHDWVEGNADTASFLRSALTAWSSIAKVTKTDRQLRNSTRADRRKYYQSLAIEFTRAAESNDSHRMWILARQLARTGLGPRLRQWGACVSYPTVAEWTAFLGQPGNLGGCLATLDCGVPELCEHLNHRHEATIAQATACAENDLDNLAIRIHTQKPYKSVPRWSVPAEVWRIIFEANDQYQSKLWHYRTAIFRMLVQIRRTASTPKLWHQSEARFLSKANEKSGPAAFRVIHLLDPFSKALHAAIWGLEEHDRWDFSVGGVSHRRRELALAQHMLLCWRLEYAKVNHIQCFYDIKNAVPSVSRDSIDEMLTRQFDEPERELLHQHHTDAVMNVMDGDGGSALLKIGSGSMQGDSIGGAIFGQVLGPYMTEGMRRIKGCDHHWPFEMDDFLTGEHVNTALSLYADDVSVVAKVSDAKNAGDTARELFWAVDSAIKPASLSLKKDFSVVYAKKCETREISARIRAADAAWFALSGLWFQHDVPLKSRIRIFTANVMSVLLAGLEAYVLSESQICKLESWRMAKVRILIEGKGTVKIITTDGEIKIRALPDRIIRKRSKMDVELPQTKTNPRKRRGASEVDSTSIQNGFKLLLQTAAQVRTVKAAVITTLLFPTEHPVIVVAKACGAKFAQECKARAGAKSVVQPHITLFSNIIKSVSQDPKAPEPLATACRKLLEQCIDLWITEGAVEPLGPGPRPWLQTTLRSATFAELQSLPGACFTRSDTFEVHSPQCRPRFRAARTGWCWRLEPVQGGILPRARGLGLGCRFPRGRAEPSLPAGHREQDGRSHAGARRCQVCGQCGRLLLPVGRQGQTRFQDHAWNSKWRWVYSDRVYGNHDLQIDSGICGGDSSLINYDLADRSQFYMPGFSWHIQHPELDLEVLALDMNVLWNTRFC